MTKIERGPALLMSGGIGDYLHYLTRLDAWADAERINRERLTIFVESTVPHQVASLFALAFPDLRFAFVPAAIHWTKTNPLLVPTREIDRINRPAYLFVAEQGFDSITDWFLPFSCSGYTPDESPLMRIVRGRPVAGSYVVVAAREKGFLWWPRRELCRQLEAMTPAGMRLVYLGTPNERHDYMSGFVSATDVVEALAISYHAALFIGTDTGAATVRELTGRKNIYCVSRFWVDELMVRYGYWNDSLQRRSRSVLTFSGNELLTACAEEFAVLSDGDARPRLPSDMCSVL
ncbi:MAG: hypothetical protein M3416_09250 [Acidobacteriota bacterium]|nr:hypothetical protein [Acidobacteriota bacterium]